MKHQLKRKVKNITVNKTQVLVVLITINRIKLKVINHQQKSVITLGDSMIKHVNGWKISQKLPGS